MSNNNQEVRNQIAQAGNILFTRHLTDLTGGNVSVRVDDKIYMTPTLAGKSFHWDLWPEQILTLDLEGKYIAGDGKISREAKVHILLLNEFFPEGTAVVHSHARNVLVFCAAEKPMPPVLSATRKFGHIPQCVDAASGTDALAENVAEEIRKQSDWVKNGSAVVMAPRHGLFVISKDISTGLETTERIDTNAYCLLAGAPLNVSEIGSEGPINPDYE